MITQYSLKEIQRTAAFALVALVGVVGLGVATAASAAVVPTVTAEARNASNATVSTVPVGTMVHVRAMVASSTSSTSPMGTVDFTRYNGTLCSGNGTLFEQNTALASGTAQSDAVAAPLGGISFRVHYDGQGDMFSEATSSCVSVSVNQYMPTVALALSSSTIYAGSSVHATTTLSNASSTSGGTVSYKVYSNNTCTNLSQNGGTMTVTNGSVPASNSLLFNTPGTYYWQGVYSGDTNTAAATSTCANAALTVLATSTGTTTPGTGTIGGKVYDDQNKNRKLDASEPGLAGFTIWLFDKSVKHYKAENAFMTAVSDANGNYLFANLPDGKYRVEEKERKSEGWNQVTKDYKSIKIKNGAVVGDINFGNASTTNNGNGNGHDKDDDDHDNGNHFGWWIGNGNSSTTISDFFNHLKNWKWNWR